MKISTFSGVLVAGLALPFSGFAANQANSKNFTSDKAAMQAVQQSETRQEKIEAALAPIKSQQELQAYLATRKLGFSPLDALSLAAKQRFLTSLRFSKGGLASFEYVDLENELTATQIYRILSLFGMQRDTRLMKNARVETETDRLVMGPDCGVLCNGDHDGYECAGKGTCQRNLDDICTSNC